MNERPLESMVTHLVQCTCNSVLDCPKGDCKELVQPKKLALSQPIINLCTVEAEGKTSMTWNAILKGLLSRCSQFSSCRDELANVPRPLVSARWRETNDRKVLAPLALKQNTDNIIAGNVEMSRKRKSDVDAIWTPTKHVKLDDTLKSCSVVIKRTSGKNLLLQYKCFSKRPFVKLFDVLKEIPQEKEIELPVHQNDFMGFLGLESRQPANTKQRPELKTGNSIRLMNNPHIPFASDYGRRLLARERHCLPQEVALRKIERTEWYLKGAVAIPKNNYNPEVIFDKKVECQHFYRFPKRQFSQNHQSLTQAFTQFVCKPAYVKLEVIDATPFMAQLKTLENDVQILPNMVPTEVSKDDVISIANCSSSADSDVIVVDCAVPSLGGDVSEVITGNSDELLSIFPFKDPCTDLMFATNNKSVDHRRSLNLFVNPVNDTKNIRRSLRLNNTNTL